MDTQTKTQTKIVIPISMRRFYDMNEIPYWLCRHKFKDGKKSVVKSTLPPSGWLGWSYKKAMSEIKKKGVGSPTTIFANIAGTDWVVLDCDDPDISKDFLDEHYNGDNYSLSLSKDLPHKYLKKDADDENMTNQLGYKKDEGLAFDVLYQQVFEKIDGHMLNYNIDTLETFTDFKKKLALPKNTIATTLEDKDRTFDPCIMDIISKDYFSKEGGYTDWRNIVFGCLYSWGLDDGRNIALKYSYHDDYSEEETTQAIDDLIKGYNEEKSPKFGSLCRYAKLSNPELYSLWYNETYFPKLPENVRDLGLKMLMAEFKDKIVICNNETYFKQPNKPVFVSGKDRVTRELYKHVCNNPDMYKYVENYPDGPRVEEVDTVKGINDVIKIITANAPENDKFICDIIDENKYRIWFNDGYYNSISREFVKTTNERTCLYIDRPMCSVSDTAIRADIRAKILLKLFNCRDDLADYYLYTIRMAMECKVSIKKFYEITGKRDCGKSILIKMLENCFGSYVSVLSIGNFYIKQGDNESRDLGFLLQTPFARLWVLNENMPNKVLNGSIIKSLCSGGDQMKVRALYKEETVISPQGTLYMFANHQLAVEPLDTNEKRVSITLHNKFVEAGTKEVYSNVKYYEADHTIDDYIRNEDIINEFTLMVLTAKPCTYPEDLLENEDVDVEDNMDTRLLSEFVYNEGSKLGPKAIRTYLKESELGIKPKELRHLLLGLIKGVTEQQDKSRNISLINICCIAGDEIDAV